MNRVYVGLEIVSVFARLYFIQYCFKNMIFKFNL